MRGFLSIGLGLLLVLLAPQAQAQDRPLLVEGKTTLYQRVLSRPGATLHESPGGTALEEAVPMRAFCSTSTCRPSWLDALSSTRRKKANTQSATKSSPNGTGSGPIARAS